MKFLLLIFLSALHSLISALIVMPLIMVCSAAMLLIHILMWLTYEFLSLFRRKPNGGE